MRLGESIEAYLRRRPGLSLHTRRKISYNTQRWLRFLDGSDFRVPTEDDLCAFRAWGLKRGLSASSIESTVRDLLAVCRDAGHHVKPGKRLSQPVPAPDVPTVEQVGAIYAHAHVAVWPCRSGNGKLSRPWWCRCTKEQWWQAWIVVASYWGLRHASMEQLTWEDIETGKHRAPKTKKEHILIKPDFVSRHLENVRGIPFPFGQNRSRAQLRRELKRMSQAAGVRRVTPQQLREFSITQWSLASSDAGRIMHGEGLAVRRHYVPYRTVLESAAPDVVMPEAFYSDAEIAEREHGENALLSRFRRARSVDRQLILEMSKRLTG